MKYIYLSVTLLLLVFSNLKIESNASTVLSDSALYCIVSGEKIEGEGVKVQYLNTEVKLCCEGCEKSFKKNPAKFLKGAGLRCPVCDEDDANKEISYVSEGVKYYFCGKGCKKNFEADPDSYLKKYNK